MVISLLVIIIVGVEFISLELFNCQRQNRKTWQFLTKISGVKTYIHYIMKIPSSLKSMLSFIYYVLNGGKKSRCLGTVD